MKALSINQPWAWAIVNNWKSVENRGWDTKYRGEFFVHAGKKFDKEGYEFLKKMIPDFVLPAEEEFKGMMGGIVGKARLINTVHISKKHLLINRDKPWFFGEYGFMLDDAEPCELRPCKGALGFFTPDYNSRYAEPKNKHNKTKQGSLL